MPAFELARENQQDVVQHAWLDYVASIYPKFLVTDDFNSHEELELFYSRLGASLLVRLANRLQREVELTKAFSSSSDESRRQQRARNEELEKENEALQKEWDELNAKPVRRVFVFAL